MKLQAGRFLSGEGWKGTRDYLKTQKRYEIARTVFLFGISGALLAAGWIGTGDRLNLLTIVAVLGCLPASKSLVSVIMFCRYHGMEQEKAEEVQRRSNGLCGLFDLVFTGNEKTFPVAHLVVKGNSICGYSGQIPFDEKAFQKHIEPLLKADGFTNCTIKIFTDFGKYLDRLDQLKKLDCDEKNTAVIAECLKSVSL